MYWNTENLASGVYLYTCQTRDNSVDGKITLVK